MDEYPFGVGISGNLKEWACQKCGTTTWRAERQDRRWICAACADSSLRPSHSKVPEPVETSTSSRFTGMHESLRFYNGEPMPIQTLMYPIPQAALITLLEAVGGSLVMEAQEVMEPRPFRVSCKWVQTDYLLGQQPRLYVELEPE